MDGRSNSCTILYNWKAQWLFSFWEQNIVADGMNTATDLEYVCMSDTKLRKINKRNENLLFSSI
jgi:hypothetical protein